MELRDLRPVAGQSLQERDWKVRMTLDRTSTELVGVYSDRSGGRLTVTVSELVSLVEHAEGRELVCVRIRSEDSFLRASVSGVDPVDLDATLAQGQEFVRRLAIGQLRLVAASPRTGRLRPRQACPSHGQLG